MQKYDTCKEIDAEMEKEESSLHPTIECLSEFTTFEQGLLWEEGRCKHYSY